MVQALDARGIAVEHLVAVIGMGQLEADPFDLLCHLAFSTPVHTRRERADRVRQERREFFARYVPEARAILDAILDHYASYGPTELVLLGVLHLPAIAKRGNTLQIAALFGGGQQLRKAVSELQTLLYVA